MLRFEHHLLNLALLVDVAVLPGRCVRDLLCLQAGRKALFVVNCGWVKGIEVFVYLVEEIVVVVYLAVESVADSHLGSDREIEIFVEDRDHSYLVVCCKQRVVLGAALPLHLLELDVGLVADPSQFWASSADHLVSETSADPLRRSVSAVTTRDWCWEVLRTLIVVLLR